MMTEPSDFGGLFSWSELSEKQIAAIHASPRIIVVGANGAGKTWVAEQLAARMGTELIHKDALALLTGWAQRPKVEVRAQLMRMIAADTWVLEGGPSVLSPEVCERATLIVWLDPPRSLRVWRIVRRSLYYFGRTRPEHPVGNRDWPGVRQFRFVWRAWARDEEFRQIIAGAFSQTSCPILRLKTRDAVSNLIEAAGEGAKGL